MPRKLTSEEIEAQKDFMYERTVKLIARKDIDSIILAVQKKNYAVKMYKSVGFEIVDENCYIGT